VKVTKTEQLFIENLKRARNQAGFSQEKLSELIGKGTKYISALEMGTRYPSPEAFQKIADTLGLEPYQLLLDHSSLSQAEEVQHLYDFSSYVAEHMGTLLEEMKAQYLRDKSEK
jgi:transcriptional regulator with XRE-family HTH domain